MTDAEKREKVIRGFEACNRKSYNGSDCQNCPYYDDEDTAELPFGICNIQDMFDDALVLLKAQMPRVMTWGEIVHSIKIKSPAIWLEDRDKIHVIPALTIVSYATNSENATFVMRGKRIVANHSDYGKRWRAWTARPTEEQRKAVTWDA